MDIADNISSKIVSLPFTVAAAVGMTVLFRPALKPSLWVTVVFVPVLCLAFLVRFLVEWTLGLAAFWTTRINAINQIHHMALLFFSGQIAPYELLPRPLQWASSVLPFRWTLGFPVELILGRLTPNQVLTGIAAQAVWLVAALALLKIAWRASLKKYSAVGG